MGSGHTTAPLLPGGGGGSTPRRRRWAVAVLGLIAAAAVIATVGLWGPAEPLAGPAVPLAGPAGGPCGDSLAAPVARGVKEGVSDKSSGVHKLGADPCGFPWTNNMLAWQRTAFHFQPQMNWMNDPNGPMFYKGWYHLFYQWNPDSAIWGNITWGHAVSRDLLRWLHLPQAMVGDQWYDAHGVFSGSATFLPDGRIVMVYTGSTNASAQVQNIAFPADPEDPLLLSWVKSESNPVLLPPPGVGDKDFRDPTTAWLDPLSGGSSWLFAIGSKDDSHAGVALVYRTKDFVRYDRLPGALHAVPTVGMWECLDFYPISTVPSDGETVNGLDTSAAPGPGVKHVLKASMDDERHDYYAIGTYDPERNVFVPDEPEQDVGIGRRYDWGKYYASKTFYDQNKKRRVMWGWIGETDSENADLHKGWASLQAIPRTVQFDHKTGNSLLLWPVEEVETLRMSQKSFSGIRIDSGSVFPIDVQSAVQLDIEVEFEIEANALLGTIEADVGYNCSTSGGSRNRGMLGPFGVLVLADQDFSEQTAAYFYVSRGVDGNLGTHFCHDELRSSKATDIVKRVVGSTVPVLNGERLSLRILVDHSIVESFAQGGRTCITSRVYPTDAIYGKARVFLFNNATNAYVTANSLKIWEMNSTFIHQYPIKS